MDTLIGRVLDGIPADVMRNTYVIFLGDNGTARSATPPAPRVRGRMKGTVYEGGVNVPLIITGPSIEPGRVVSPLGHVVDLFATIIELAGGDSRDVVPRDTVIDSVSFAPYLFADTPPVRRTWVMAESARATAIRDATHKLIINPDDEEFYNLAEDPLELSPLELGDLTDAARTHYKQLKNRLTELRGSDTP